MSIKTRIYNLGDTAVKDGFIQENEKDVVISFLLWRASKLASSDGNINALRMFLHLVSGSLASLDRNKLIEIITEIRAKYKPNTQTYVISQARIFLQYALNEGALPKLDETTIQRVMSPPNVKLERRDPGGMLTPDEINSLIKACGNSKERAIFSILFDGALRPIEVRELRYSDLSIDADGIVIRVARKTKFNRRIRLSTSVPHMIAWLSDNGVYSDDDRQQKGDAYVFPSPRRICAGCGRNIKTKDDRCQKCGTPLKEKSYAIDTLIYRLKELKKRAGITKHLTPYVFRHSRISDLSGRKNLSEAVIKMVAWGNLNSKQIDRYTHFTDEMLDTAILSSVGITPTKQTNQFDVLSPKQCPKCLTLNSAAMEYCGRCGKPLTDTAQSVRERGEKYIASLTPEELREFADAKEKALISA